MTKLYQSKDANLRRMVYLVIKDVCPGSDEVIIITSSLMKDMNSKTDLYRSNAIRVLCSIIDSQLLGQIERYLKQARGVLHALVPATLWLSIVLYPSQVVYVVSSIINSQPLDHDEHYPKQEWVICTCSCLPCNCDTM